VPFFLQKLRQGIVQNCIFCAEGARRGSQWQAKRSLWLQPLKGSRIEDAPETCGASSMRWLLCLPIPDVSLLVTFFEPLCGS